jgi:hypothetical protein
MVHVLLRVELRRISADDLVGTVPFNALRAFVPGGDETLGIKHQDRVVLDTIDQTPESFFTVCKGGSS